ncbi:hypothetical protein MUP59_02010 [Candidatus Bathyarchaeota archaeon]|nr:hypothetical protein [Candidatus Bathyarchaeota archaeon]
MADFVFSRLEATKAAFALSEPVTINYTINCRGIPIFDHGSATIRVIDANTGLPVQRFGRDVVFTTPDIRAGESYALDGASVGNMPDHNWNLRFELTP